MIKRKEDLLSPKTFGLIIGVIVFGEMAFILDFGIHGRYLEAILSAFCGIGLILIYALSFLYEIIGSIRDLKGVLEGREKEDIKKPA